jgi:hypothetical protein
VHIIQGYFLPGDILFYVKRRLVTREKENIIYDFI